MSIRSTLRLSSKRASFHQQNSDFFVETTPKFKQILKSEPFKSMSYHEIKEIELKCNRHGFFEEDAHQMLRNFILYLSYMLTLCTNLRTLKIIIAGHYLNQFKIDINLFNEDIGEIFTSSNLQKNQLKGQSKEKNILDARNHVNDQSIFKTFMQAYEHNLEQPKSIFQIIKVIISNRLKQRDYQFETLWIHANHMRQCKAKDFENILQISEIFGRLKGKQISIQTSCWSFISQSQRGMNYKKFRQILQEYAKILYDTSSNGNNIYERYTLQISSWNMSEEQALRFLGPALDQLYPKDKQNESDQSNSQQEEMTKKKYYHKLFLQFTSFLKQKWSRDITQTQLEQGNKIQEKLRSIIKYPTEHVIQGLVQHFHKKMITFVSSILNDGLGSIQDFHIDMRNWNPLFNMIQLKKKLDTHQNKKPEYSIVFCKNRRGGRIDKRQKEKQILKTQYMM